MAPASALCIFLGSAIVEMPTMIANGDCHLISKHWLLFFLASTLGLCINLCSFLVIQLTSGVTIKILGTVRNALLVLFTVFGQGASGESVSDMQFLGYFAGQKVHIFRRPKTTYFSPAQNHIFFAGPKSHIFRRSKSAHFSPP